MKRIALILALATACVLVMSGLAVANFGPHGGYYGDTDQCAGCHRAHTSFSPIQRTDYFNGGLVGSALLVSSAQTMVEFCLVCHGDYAPGASTNVESGIFDSGPSGDINGNTLGGVSKLYDTNSSFDTTLNGGAFSTFGPDAAPVSSTHDMYGYSDSNTTTGYAAPVWGYGNSVSDADNATLLTQFSCNSCHDPHGSSNYRLLKDILPVGTVGGWSDNDGQFPTPFVISAEENYPIGGWKRHEAGETQATLYKPNYTSAEYGYIGDASKSISGWCAGCHEQYNISGGTASDVYDYEGYEAEGGEEVGSRVRHRHPVNRALGVSPNISLAIEPTTSEYLPLELKTADLGLDYADRFPWGNDDLLGCLTCHFAHGTDAQMSGWAEASLVNSSSAETSWVVQLDPGSGGVNPNKSSALLRRDDRGVCERCHNK